MYRLTVGKTVTIKGTGLHKGREVMVTVRPGDAGIVFVRDGVEIPATSEYVVDTRLNTTIGAGGATVATVEHFMSALAGLGLTDAEITVQGDEMPAMDGSALPFLECLAQAGCTSLGAIEPARLAEPLEVLRGDSWITASPGPFAVAYEIDFPEPAIGRQSFVYRGDGYAAAIAPARTFGRLSDVDMMRSLGLALGGGLHNAVVVDGAAVLNPEGLRFPDEFIRHKVLDCLGDLWTLGRPVMAHIQAFKANHGLHIALARKIREQVQREATDVQAHP